MLFARKHLINLDKGELFKEQGRQAAHTCFENLRASYIMDRHNTNVQYCNYTSIVQLEAMLLGDKKTRVANAR